MIRIAGTKKTINLIFLEECHTIRLKRFLEIDPAVYDLMNYLVVSRNKKSQNHLVIQNNKELL